MARPLFLAGSFIVGSLFVGAFAGCRCGQTEPPVANGDAGGLEASGSASSQPDEALAPRFVDPRSEAQWLDGGADPACSGGRVELAKVVHDARCAIGPSTAKALRAAFEADKELVGALRQEAKQLEGDRIEIRIVNVGKKALMLPLSYHPKIDAFIVLADEAKGKAVYELAPPRFEVAAAPADAGAARDGGVDIEQARGHFARVLLAPGASAVARIVLDPAIARRLDREAAQVRGDAGADAGADAGPKRLTAGTWMLHIGQLLSDVPTGEPAQLALTVP